ncbi:hypothetical protein VTJ04DRAFT_9896 [Mycothermus thermophilus]|uniref:uncharacterized protein n=1 Tax=Humicola insolens TaxID=85995 RepID=UPI003742728F
MNTTASPIPIPAPAASRQRMDLHRLVTGQEDLFASLNATLSADGSLLGSTPVRHIREHDYSVPAPPPPSPVGSPVSGWRESWKRC